MTKLPALFTVSLALALLVTVGRAAEIEWSTESNMDRQLFPSLLIATATQRPQEDEEDAKEPDPYVLGDQFGLVGVSIKAPKANAQVTVTLKENELMAAATWSGELPEEGKDYSIAPKVNYKFDRLRRRSR